MPRACVTDPGHGGGTAGQPTDSGGHRRISVLLLPPQAAS